MHSKLNTNRNTQSAVAILVLAMLSLTGCASNRLQLPWNTGLAEAPINSASAAAYGLDSLDELDLEIDEGTATTDMQHVVSSKQQPSQPIVRAQSPTLQDSNV